MNIIACVSFVEFSFEGSALLKLTVSTKYESILVCILWSTGIDYMTVLESCRDFSTRGPKKVLRVFFVLLLLRGYRLSFLNCSAIQKYLIQKWHV